MTEKNLCPICGIDSYENTCPVCGWDFINQKPYTSINKDRKEEFMKKENEMEDINLCIEEIWININPNCPHGCLGIEWSSDIGFGQYELVLDEHGIFHTFTEGMDSEEDKSFSKAVFKKLLDKIIIDE